MPLLRIQTNAKIDDRTSELLLGEASKVVARELGKPESYVMIAVDAATPMVFAGSPSPTAFLELRSIGLADGAAPALSRALCDLMERTLGIANDRVFINFAAVPSGLWGWNGATF